MYSRYSAIPYLNYRTYVFAETMFINVTDYRNINKMKEHFEIDVNKEQWVDQ